VLEVEVLREVLNLEHREVVGQADAGCKDRAVWQVAREVTASCVSAQAGKTRCADHSDEVISVRKTNQHRKITYLVTRGCTVPFHPIRSTR